MVTRSTFPRATGPPQGTAEARLSPVSGALQFPSHPPPRCCRARNAYSVCDETYEYVTLVSPERNREAPRYSAGGGGASLLSFAGNRLPFLISRLLRQLVLRQIETAAHCAEKYS